MINRKLGRQPKRNDPRTLLLSAYLPSSLPAPPIKVDWSKGQTSWGEYLNDSLGDCTIAGVAHLIQTWAINSSKALTFADNDVLKYYIEWDGYNPKDSKTDQGGNELDVLNKWRTTKFNGHILHAYAATNVHNIQEIKTGINLFGGLYIGVGLPLTAQTQNGTWDVVNNASDGTAEPFSWGGHCVSVCGYDAKYVYIITWGEIYKLTWNFWLKYVDEAYCLIGEDWFNVSGIDPTGLNVTQLDEDLKIVTK
jgi:hypothetical protein